MSYFNSDELRKVARSAPTGTPVFLMQMRPVEGNALFSYISSSTPLKWVPCSVHEERYKLEDGYKITLCPTIPGFVQEHFYQMDLALMVRSGSALVLDQSRTWQSQIPKPPKVSLSEKLAVFKGQLLAAIRLPRLS